MLRSIDGGRIAPSSHSEELGFEPDGVIAAVAATPDSELELSVPVAVEANYPLVPANQVLEHGQGLGACGRRHCREVGNADDPDHVTDSDAPSG